MISQKFISQTETYSLSVNRSISERQSYSRGVICPQSFSQFGSHQSVTSAADVCQSVSQSVNLQLDRQTRDTDR